MLGNRFCGFPLKEPNWGLCFLGVIPTHSLLRSKPGNSLEGHHRLLLGVIPFLIPCLSNQVKPSCPAKTEPPHASPTELSSPHRPNLREGLWTNESRFLAHPQGLSSHGTRRSENGPFLGSPVERLKCGFPFSEVYLSRGTLPTKKGQKGTTGGPSFKRNMVQTKASERQAPCELLGRYLIIADLSGICIWRIAERTNRTTIHMEHLDALGRTQYVLMCHASSLEVKTYFWTPVKGHTSEAWFPIS